MLNTGGDPLTVAQSAHCRLHKIGNSEIYSQRARKQKISSFKSNCWLSFFGPILVRLYKIGNSEIYSQRARKQKISSFKSNCWPSFFGPILVRLYKIGNSEIYSQRALKKKKFKL